MHSTYLFSNLLPANSSSLSIGNFSESIVNQLVKFKKLKILYILFNFDEPYGTDTNGALDNDMNLCSTVTWLGLKQIKPLEKLLLCNITIDLNNNIKKLFPKKYSSKLRI